MQTFKRLCILGLILGAAGYSGAILGEALSLAPGERVQFIPDDGFYYLALARNFTQFGEWTFDSGVSRTSGFHIIHAYFLAFISLFYGNFSEDFVKAALIGSFSVWAAFVVAAGRFIIQRNSLIAALTFCLFCTSRNVTLNSISLMEWAAVVLTSAAYCHAFVAAEHTHRTTYLFLLGLLGSLARSDFGLLPLCLLLAALIINLPRLNSASVRAAASGLGGAVIGVFLIFAHHLYFTGDIIQSSVRMKVLWNRYAEIPDANFINICSQLFGAPGIVTASAAFFITCFSVLLGLEIFFRSFVTVNAPEVNNRVRTLWLASMLTIAGLLCLFTLKPAGVQPWYTANIIVPYLLLIVLPVEFSFGREKFLTRTLHVIPALTLGYHLVKVPAFFSGGEWPHQRFLYEAGTYLAQNHPQEIVGSWNAGIVGFYAGRGVVNLDGLVNNDIYDYASRNDLEAYIDSRAIKLVLDFRQIFSLPSMRKRGGYDSQKFLERLSPIRQFDNEDEGWSGLALYRIGEEKE